MHTAFTGIARAIARFTGHPSCFALAFGVVLLWALSGPIFAFSSDWQLVVNTGTTIVTFLMVFLIQNTQNRDTEAMQIKLDELIRALRGADNAMMDLEELEEQELDVLRERYEQLAQQARSALEGRREKQP